MLCDNHSKQINKPNVYLSCDVLTMAGTADQMFKQDKIGSQLIVLVVCQSVFNSLPKLKGNIIVSDCVV